MTFDITANSPGAIGAHLRRPYGPGLIITTYDRPTWFSLFP